ncbi:hypothetical protein F511_10842 [Dorcoceras hygrometricum]|uniref:Uncharacterized protein n=1 Tax=Dorcoceras hygrometricum TaxID=472368 RepID=A0A2Z7BJ31_9LAMI|nr:hypothetical protein F511_10842 [Dorcoceras hygrometricum]
MSEKSNAIVGAVTTGYECLPPSCDGLTGPDDHGPMISRLIDRAVMAYGPEDHGPMISPIDTLPQAAFDTALEFKAMKRIVESLVSKVDMVRDTQIFMKHDSNLLRRAIYRKMDEVVTSVNTSHTALETILVRQFIDHRL